MDASLGIQATPSQIGQPLNDDNSSSRSLFAFTYPNLFASMEKGEDILMAAARLMDGMYIMGSNCCASLKAFENSITASSSLCPEKFQFIDLPPCTEPDSTEMSIYVLPLIR